LYTYCSNQGTDTSAIASTMTIFFLALHPELQKKAQEEVDKVFEANGNKPLKFGDASKLKYLQMCMKEAMRIHPPVPMFGRTTGEDILLG